MAGETILIVEDDADIREIITMYLENEGYQVISATDGKQALTSVFSLKPDLIILDMMLPNLDGIEVCQEIRKKLFTPIIFLSCKGTPVDKPIGLAAGGDDYMSKPFEPIELLARIKAHLRRSRFIETSKTNQNTLTFPSLTIDLVNYSVVSNEQPVTLSPKEFQLLALLAQTPNTVFRSEELFESLWGAKSFGDHRTVMVHISNIRKKIEQDPTNPKYILTVKGLGYKFCSQ